MSVHKVLVIVYHFENTPMQYIAIYHGSKNDNFQMKIVTFFLFLLKTQTVGTR